MEARHNQKYAAFFAILSWVTCFLPSVNAALQDRPHHPDKFMVTKATPRINGNFDDPSWKDVALIDQFVYVRSDLQQMPPYKTLVRLAYDSKSLYIALRCMKPKDSTPVALGKERDKLNWQADDIIEVFIGPNAKKAPYYQFAVNPNGTKYDGCGWDGKWNGEWAAKTSIKPDYWDITFSIPARTVGAPSIENGDMWYLKIFRNRYYPGPTEKIIREITGFLYAEATHTGPYAEMSFGTFQFMRKRLLEKLKDRISDLESQMIQNIRSKAGDDILQRALKLYPDFKTDQMKQGLVSDIDFFLNYVESKPDMDARQDQRFRKSIDGIKEEIRCYQNRLNRLYATALDLKQARSEKTPAYGITTLPLYELFFEEKPLKNMTNAISLNLAKGETRGFQVIILPFGKNLNDVKIIAPAFRAGTKRCTDWAEILRIKYFDIVNYDLSDELGVRYYPDPVVPYFAQPVHKDAFLAIYVRVTVPIDIPAGDYVARLIVAPKKEEQSSVQVNLHVYDFDASKSPDATLAVADYTTMLGSYTKYIQNRKMVDEESYLKTVKAMMRHLIKYRIRQATAWCGFTPFFNVQKDPATGAWKADVSLLEKVMEIGFEEGMTRLIIHGTNYKVPERADAYFRALGEMAKRRGWQGKIVAFIFDEPWEHDMPLFERFAAVAHEAGLLVTSGSTCFPEVNKTQAKHVDYWYTAGIQPELREMHPNDEMITYINDTYLGHPLTQPRGNFWAIWKYKYDGYSYFAHAWWTYGNLWETRPGYAGMLEEMRCYPPEHFPNRFDNKHDGVRGDADTFEVYSCLRLEAQLDGLVDYTYVHKLHTLCSKLRRLGKEDLARQGEACISKWQDILIRPDKALYNRELNYIPYEKARCEIARLIEKLSGEFHVSSIHLQFPLQ